MSDTDKHISAIPSSRSVNNNRVLNSLQNNQTMKQVSKNHRNENDKDRRSCGSQCTE